MISKLLLAVSIILVAVFSVGRGLAQDPTPSPIQPPIVSPFGDLCESYSKVDFTPPLTTSTDIVSGNSTSSSPIPEPSTLDTNTNQFLAQSPAIDEFEKNRWKASNRFMLILTVAEYDEQSWNIPIEDLQAPQIANYFADLGYKGYGQATPKILDSQNTTRDSLLNELRGYALTANDSLTIYIIAHGSSEDEEFHIFLRNSSLSITDITNVLKSKESRNFIFLDSCHSGKALENNTPISHLRNTVIITATRDHDQKTEEISISPGAAGTIQNLNVRASAFSYYLTRALDKDWDLVDGGDGLISYDELTDYLKRRLKCGYHNKTVNVTMVPSIIGLNKDELLAFRRSKVRDPNSYQWSDVLTQAVYAILEERLYKAQGNATLIKQPNLYSGLFISIIGRIRTSANLPGINARKVHTVKKLPIDKDIPILKLGTEFKELNDQLKTYEDHFAGNDDKKSKTLKLLSSGDFDSAAFILADIKINPIDHNSKQPTASQKDYLLLALAERSAGNISSAIETYDRALLEYPDDPKLMIEKASTLIFLPGDSTNKKSIDLALAAIKAEIKVNGKVSSSTEKSLERFQGQLDFLKRSGDLATFNQALSEIKSTSQP